MEEKYNQDRWFNRIDWSMKLPNWVSRSLLYMLFAAIASGFYWMYFIDMPKNEAWLKEMERRDDVRRENRLRATGRAAVTEVNARMFLSQQDVSIINDTGYDWKNVKLTLNGAFTADIAVIHSRQTIHIPLTIFSKQDGALFNPSAYRVRKLSIYCKTPGGIGYYTGAWK